MTLLSRLFSGTSTPQDISRLGQLGGFLSQFGASAAAAGQRGTGTAAGLAGALSQGNQGLSSARRDQLALKNAELNARILEEREKERKVLKTVLGDKTLRNTDGTINLKAARKRIGQLGGPPRLLLTMRQREAERAARKAEREEDRKFRASEGAKNRVAAAGRSAAARLDAQKERKLRREELKQRREEIGVRRQKDRVQAEKRRLRGVAQGRNITKTVRPRDEPILARANKLLDDKSFNPDGRKTASEAFREARKRHISELRKQANEALSRASTPKEIGRILKEFRDRTGTNLK